MSLAATVAGIVTFAATEHLPWAWLAIGGLLALVISLGWELRGARARLRAAAGSGTVAALLERAIADGRALLTLHEGGGYQWEEWRAWRKSTAQMLREHVGTQAVYAFDRAEGSEQRPRGARIADQIASLETLQAERDA